MFFKGEHTFLSNMTPCGPIVRDGIAYSCTESAYQAAKCANPAERILFAKLNGYEAKKLGRRIRVRPDWNEIRVDVMRDVLKQKFSDPTLLARLKAVQEPIYEDNTWRDTFWGRYNGIGENILGKLLMEIRDATP